MTVTKFKRVNGKYLIKEKKFEQLVGSRAQVWHGTAFKTSGGLTKDNLYKNKTGRIVSKNKHLSAKKEKRLEKAGYKTKKGHFGFIKDGKKSKTLRKGRKRSKKRRK
jgi:hypothetical protein